MSAFSAPDYLRTEYKINPLGLGERRPRFSWEVKDTRRGARQSAYHLLAASSQEKLDKNTGDIWDSGKVTSDQSVHVEYAGGALKSGQRVFWKVRTFDAQGTESSWSAGAWFEMGLLQRAEWKGEWITTPLVGGPRTSSPCPFLRREFNLDKPLKSARLYATALGLVELHLNGSIVGDVIFAPGWTDYNKRVQYHAYDVTSKLKTGANAWGAVLGDGWYCGGLEWRGRQRYGDKPKFLAQLLLTFTDGSTQLITTDNAWTYTTGPLLEADMLNGEAYDARRELGAWSEVGGGGKDWTPVTVISDPGMAIVASPGPAVKRIMEIKPVKDPTPRHGWEQRAWIYDMGQNMVGRVRLKVSGTPGATVTIRHAEVLDKNGAMYTENLRSAKCIDSYTLKGSGVEIWEPRFTFHGFRYVELSTKEMRKAGKLDDVNIDSVTGIVLHSDTPLTGSFECSEPLVNQLQHNIEWGQRGNFLEVPTDCPQRDERLGWTGDAQVFIRTAAFNMDVASFFTKWQDDVDDSQSEKGEIPPVIPNTDVVGNDGGPAWSDAAIICPWIVYRCYGDKRILENHYTTYVRLVEWFRSSSKDLIRAYDGSGWQGFGDWLSINAETSKDLIGTVYFAYSARLLSKIAAVLNKTVDAKKYQQLFEDVRKAFNHRYVTAAGLLSSHSQTAYVLALHFDLLPPELRANAAHELVLDIERRGNKLSTGFVGSSYLPHALTNSGKLDTAYKLLHQKQWPSWLYAVTQGATTIWERWDGWTHDKGFQDAGMNSFNHYAYGAIGEWLYSNVAGLDLDSERPGYKHSVIKPKPGGGLMHAKARLRSVYGVVESGWKIEGGKLTLKVTVPANTTACVFIPSSKADGVNEGGKPLDKSESLKLIGNSDGYTHVQVGVGEYVFEAATI